MQQSMKNTARNSMWRWQRIDLAFKLKMSGMLFNSSSLGNLFSNNILFVWKNSSFYNPPPIDSANHLFTKHVWMLPSPRCYPHQGSWHLQMTTSVTSIFHVGRANFQHLSNGPNIRNLSTHCSRQQRSSYNQLIDWLYSLYGIQFTLEIGNDLHLGLSLFGRQIKLG